MTLRDYLTKKSITLTQFADSIGVSRQCVYNWINGKAAPTVPMAHNIASITDGCVGYNEWVRDGGLGATLGEMFAKADEFLKDGKIDLREAKVLRRFFDLLASKAEAGKLGSQLKRGG